jgi:hypothetical protein
MPGTPHSVLNHESLCQGSAVVGTDSADREDFTTSARKQHGFFADVTCKRTSIGEVIDCDAARQIGTGGF